MAKTCLVFGQCLFKKVPLTSGNGIVRIGGEILIVSSTHMGYSGSGCNLSQSPFFSGLLLSLSKHLMRSVLLAETGGTGSKQ